MVKPKGWFAIPGVQLGDRTVDEQLLGLDPLLASLAGKSVLDLGCAEGLISQACWEAGARRVIGLENNTQFLDRARGLRLDAQLVQFMAKDLNERPDEEDRQVCASDVVLMLAILHKLRQPRLALQDWAGLARERVVVRLPIGSTGVVRFKHGKDKQVDLNREMPALGFAHEATLRGPRGELVQYWRR